jgi:hypothetical protein
MFAVCMLLSVAAVGDESPDAAIIEVVDRAYVQGIHLDADTADAAVAKVDLHRNGKHIFTDYIALYRFDDGWKLVGKTFQRL